MQKTENLLPEISIEKAQEPPTLEELRQNCREKVARMFAERLPEVAQGMIDLALTSEVDAVKLKAQTRILQEFQEFRDAKPIVGGGTNVQIINAIPFERAAYEKGKELQQVDIGNLRVAAPNYKRVLPTGEDKDHTSRKEFASGMRLSESEIDSRRMDRIGGNDYSPEPADLKVPVK